jgi:hypothetical protein
MNLFKYVIFEFQKQQVSQKNSDIVFFFSLFILHTHTYLTIMESQEDISDRIAAARREADMLKERIKQRKEALADTTCNNKTCKYILANSFQK